jgi:hypothetical protein
VGGSYFPHGEGDAEFALGPVEEGRQGDPHIADRFSGEGVGLGPETVRLVLGAQPGEVGADLRAGDLGDVLVASALNPFG